MTPPTTTEHRTPAGGTTAELVLHARIAGHPVQLAALIGDGSWQFAGTLSFDIETGAPDLGALLQSLLTQAGLPALPPAMIPSVTVKEMTARYAAETFALAGTFEIGAGRGPLRVLFASLPKGQGCVVALAFDGDIPLRVDVLRGVVPDISVGGLRVTYASEAVADVPAAVAALLPTAGANGQQRALARGLTFGARLGTATAGQDLMLTRPPSETAATPAKRGDGGTTPAAPAPDRYRAAICRRELPAAARPGSRVGPCQSRHPRSGGGACVSCCQEDDQCHSHRHGGRCRPC
jgi:hypothetical protein